MVFIRKFFIHNPQIKKKKKKTLQEVDFFQAFLEICPFSQVMTEKFSCLPQIHLRCLLSPVSMGSLSKEFTSLCHTSSCPSFRPLTHKCSIAESQRYQTCCHTYWTGATNTAVLPPTQDVSTAFPLYPSHLKSDAVIFFRYIFYLTKTVCLRASAPPGMREDILSFPTW